MTINNFYNSRLFILNQFIFFIKFTEHILYSILDKPSDRYNKITKRQYIQYIILVIKNCQRTNNSYN